MYSWTPSDFEELIALSQARGIAPSQPAMIFLEESGLDPTNGGPSGASPPVGGLNQMSSDNLSAIGLTRARWLAMSAAEQLPYIFSFWDSLAAKDNGGAFPADAGTLLALNFLPASFAASHAGSNPNAVVAGKNGPYASDYAANVSLDPSGSGSITPATCALRLANVAAASPMWPGFLAELQSYTPPSWATPAKVLVGGLGVGLVAYWLFEQPWARLPFWKRIA